MEFALEDKYAKLLASVEKDERMWAVKPIPGYNRTTYTVSIWAHGDSMTGSCNCTFAFYNRLCSHLLAVLIKANLWTGKRITVIGGVRRSA